MNAADVFKELPNRCDPDAIGDTNVVVQFSLSGDGGGEWYLRIADGACTVEEGKADSPQATLNMVAADFVAMFSGELNAMAAFMTGKIKVQGDLGTVMKLQPILGM